MLAGHRRLSNLVLVVDRNHLQQGARTEDTNGLNPLDDKFRAFGWDVAEVDGHDVEALREALTASHDRPLVVIARTVKGKGVSFMEDVAAWHHKVPSRRAGRRRTRGARTMTGIRPRRAPRAHLRLPCPLRGDPYRTGRRRSAHRGGVQRLRRVEQPGGVRAAVPRPPGQRGHRRAEHGRRRGRPGERGLRAVRVRRRAVPDRASDGADQGRRRVQPVPT